MNDPSDSVIPRPSITVSVLTPLARKPAIPEYLCFSAVTGSFQRLDIRKVLGSAGCSLVLEQILAAEERHLYAFDGLMDAMSPGRAEIHSCDRSKNIDTARRQANLNNSFWLLEILFRDVE